MFRRLVIVPYGRMQLVDLTAGPIHRLLGITTVQLHTAAATTRRVDPRASRPTVAADLRDRLARRGEQRSAGPVSGAATRSRSRSSSPGARRPTSTGVARCTR